MAIVKLAVTTTLPIIEQRIRKKSHTLSAQQSKIISAQMEDIIHSALVNVRTLFGMYLDSVFSTDATVTESTNKIDISTLDIANYNNLTLYDITHGPIPILETDQFFQDKFNLSADTKLLIARVTRLTITGNDKLAIETVRGSTVSSPGNTITLVYPRNPIKTIKSDADLHLDIPEGLTPLVESMAVVDCYTIVKREAPKEAVNNVAAYLQLKAAEYGVELKPRTS